MVQRRGRLIVMGAAGSHWRRCRWRSGAADGGPTAHAAAIAAGDPIRAEVRNGTTAKETEIIGKFNASKGSRAAT